MEISESLLVFSDVHLGSDLNDCSAGGTKRSASIDRDLVALLTHYRAAPVPAVSTRWRIVIAGDFIDFIGMSITSTDALTELTEEERIHGLGNAEDHAREKMRRVAVRHADVLRALALFVADGHALTIIHGNHDIEFHWDGVKEDFRAALLGHARAIETPAHAPLDPSEFLGRIEFAPWFFYRDGIAYIEHGHQYDPFCSTMHVMAPVSPLDPRRVARGFSDVLLRYVVRPTRGMSEHGHEGFGLIDYVAFGVRLGLSGMFGLGRCFVEAIVELFRVRRAQLSARSAELRAEHDRRVAKLADATRLGIERLRTLLSLQAKPITHTIGGIMGSVLLDRFAVACGAVLTLMVLAIVGIFHAPALYGIGGVLLAWGLLHVYFSRRRHVDPSAALAERAAHLSRLFPAAFVVMGHTHAPVESPAGDATYINLGSWAEDESVPDAIHASLRAARTHVVIHPSADGARAQFMTWDPDAGVAKIYPRTA